MVQRPWRLALLLAVFLSYCCCSGSSQGFMLDPQHSGRCPNEGPSRPYENARYDLEQRVLAGPALLGGGVVVGTLEGTLFHLSEELSFVWSLKLGVRIYATPLVGQDGDVYIGTSDGSFFRISQGGQIQWARTYGCGIVSSAVADEKNVYFGLWDGRLICLSLDGDEEWTFQTGYLIYSAPALDHSGNILIGSADGCIYSLSQDGSLNWQYQTGDAIYASPSIDASNNVYVGSYDGYFYSLSPTGHLRWRVETENQIHGTAGIAEDGTIFFASTDRKLYALQSSGEILWTHQDGNLGSPVIDSAGYLFIDRGFDSIDKLTSSGERVVGFSVDRGDDLWGAQPLISDSGLLYYVSVNGVVFCMGDEHVSARLTESAEIGKSLHGLQEVGSELVALDWHDGSLYKVNLETLGATLLCTLPHILMDIAVDGDTLYAGMDRNGTAISAYNLASGKPEVPLTLEQSVSLDNNEIWGLEKSESSLYVMGKRRDVQVIVEYDLAQQRIVSEGTVPSTAGELIGLQKRDGKLLTFSWCQGVIYEAIPCDGVVALREVARVEFLVPKEDIAPGGFRGFYLGQNSLYLTSVAYGVYSRLHVARYPDGFGD